MNVLVSTHRGAITWYLSKKLTEASDVQRNQQEVRLMREVEKSRRCGRPHISLIQYR
jgi:syntaxin 18